MVCALEMLRNHLAQTLQIDGAPQRIKQFLHILGGREEKAQPTPHAGVQTKEWPYAGTTILHQPERPDAPDFSRRRRKYPGHRPARFSKSISELVQYTVSISYQEDMP
jgi:hypothetical protein